MRIIKIEPFENGAHANQTINGVIQSIGLEPCKLCTYCWNGKE